MKKLRIVVASDVYRPSRGGTETTTENLARGLAALGHEVLVIAPGGSATRSRLVEDDEGQRVFRVRSYSWPIVPRLRLSLLPYPEIARQLGSFKPDIIHVNNHWSLGQALIRYGKRHNVPVICGIHFMPESFLFNVRLISIPLYQALTGYWWRRIARIYNQGAGVVGPSQTAVSYLTSNGLKVPGYAISNGVDLSLYHPTNKRPEALRKELGLPDRPTVVYVGRMAPEKQLDEVVDAVAKARRTLDLQLVLVGEGWARQDIENRARKLGIGKRVICTGYVDTNQQKVQYMRAGDLFVMPSTVEMQSIVTLEAMACGKPVAAVNEGALPELVASGENGELFQPRDSKKLAQILIGLLTNKQRLSQYAAKSLDKARHHDITEMPQRHIDLYQEVLAKSR